MKSTTTKIVASIAVVGSIAAIAALLGTRESAQGGRFLAQAEGTDSATVEAFQTFITKHNKNYLTKEEYNARLQIFKNNLDLIKNHNAEKEGFELGVNKFADISQEEYEKMLGLKIPEVPDQDIDEDLSEEDNNQTSVLTAPASVDWRQSGAVNSVRN